jgi:predicted  nucleic acid-binding Zn-ribbon protein
VLLGLLVSAGFLLAACSSSAPTASQKVCDDRAQLNQAVSTVVNDLKSGNLGQAKDDASAVGEAVDNLSQSAQGLQTEQSQALSPQIDHLKKTASSLRNASSLSDLQSGFSSLKSQLQSISSQIGDSLKCS